MKHRLLPSLALSAALLCGSGALLLPTAAQAAGQLAMSIQLGSAQLPVVLSAQLPLAVHAPPAPPTRRHHHVSNDKKARKHARKAQKHQRKAREHMRKARQHRNGARY